MYEIKLYKKKTKDKTKTKKQKSCRKQALFNEIIIGRMKNSKQSNTCIKVIHLAIRCQSYLSIEFFH